MTLSQNAVSALLLLLGGPALIAWNRFSYRLFRRHQRRVRADSTEGRILRPLWVSVGDALGAVCILIGLIYLFLAITGRTSLTAA